MKMSRRALRMERNHKRNKASGGLNLTALMDIFTILVFFLMVNQSEVEVQNNEDIELPVSISDNKPEDQLTILVTQTNVLIQGRSVVTVAEVLNLEGEEIPALRKELDYMAARSPLPPEEEILGRQITIVGDKDTEYQLLKKIMRTSAQAGFGNISLAVNQKTEGEA